MNLLRKKLYLLFVLLSFIVFSTAAFSIQRKFLVVGEEFAPFEFIQDSQVVGLDIDIARYIFNKMNIPVVFKIQPWKRAWKNAEKGKADAILTTSRKESRKPYLWYPEENMWVSEFVFFVRKDKIKSSFKGYSTAKKDNLTIGVINGNSYHSSFWTAFPYKNGATTFQGDLVKVKMNDQLDGTSNFKLNIKKLVKGRIDLIIADKIVGSYSAKLLNLDNKVTYYNTTLYSKGYPMPFTKNSSYPDNKKIAVKFEKELKAIKKSGIYQRFVEKWIK